MLIEDTKILLVDGKIKRIKDLNINDYLLCIEEYLHVDHKYKDIDNFKIVYSKLNLIEHIEYDKLYYINNDKLRVLYSEHIFIKRNDEYMWKIADDLLLGDYLVDYKKRLIKITSIIPVKLKEKKRFYTIKMSKNRDKNKVNTFFANGVLIHNRAGRAGGPCGTIGGQTISGKTVGTHNNSSRTLSNSRFTGWYTNFTESEDDDGFITSINHASDNNYAYHRSGNKADSITTLSSTSIPRDDDTKSALVSPAGEGRTKATYKSTSNQPCQLCGADMDGIINPFGSTGSYQSMASRFGQYVSSGHGANRVEWACLKTGWGWQMEAVNDIRLLNISLRFTNLHGDTRSNYEIGYSKAILMYIYQVFVSGTEFGQDHTAGNRSSTSSSPANYSSGPHMYPIDQSNGNKRFNLVGTATFIAPSKSSAMVHDIWTNMGVNSSGYINTSSGGASNSYYNHSTQGRLWRGYFTTDGTNNGGGERACQLSSFADPAISDDLPTWQYPDYSNNGFGDGRSSGSSGNNVGVRRIANSWNNRGIILSAGNEYLFMCGYGGTAAYGNWLTPHERYNITSSYRPGYNRKGRYTRVFGNDTTGRIALGTYFIGTWDGVGATHQFKHPPTRGNFFERTNNSGSSGTIRGTSSTVAADAFHRRNYGLRRGNTLSLYIHGPLTSGGSDYFGRQPNGVDYYSNSFHTYDDWGWRHLVFPASASGVAAETTQFPDFKLHCQRIGDRHRRTFRNDSEGCDDKSEMDAAESKTAWRIH